jgi:hypothetical protein
MKKTLYLVLILLAGFACKKDDPVEEDPDFDVTSDYYFAAVIGGEKVVRQEGVDGYLNGTAFGGGTTPDGYQHAEGMVFLKSFSQDGVVGVYLFKTFTEPPLDCPKVDGMFHLGAYNFGQASSSSDSKGKDGVVIYYVDQDGVSWSSGQSPAMQNGSSFEITEYTDLVSFTTSKVMKAKFKCTLYDLDGNSKKLAKGEIRSKCLNCNSY